MTNTTTDQDKYFLEPLFGIRSPSIKEASQIVILFTTVFITGNVRRDILKIQNTRQYKRKN